uniref:Uncharacterized protein n=1 Tax=Arundo donax TaxID=35708 RepID=A0A0A9GN12_ARUDO
MMFQLHLVHLFSDMNHETAILLVRLFVYWQFHISMIPIGDSRNIAAAAEVTDWLLEGLPSVLPKGVELQNS